MAEGEGASRVTLHLTARAVWEGQAAGPLYRPEAFDADGFIHCTDGESNLIQVANAFYQEDPREQIALVIDVGRVDVDVRYEDADRIYPHIFGPLNTDAVIATRPIVRGPHGEYLRIDSARKVGQS